MWKIVRISLVIVAATALAGCPNAGSNNQDVETARAFYRLPVTEQLKTFRQHPLEAQLDLFTFGNQVHHPPALYLARCFALGGEAAVQLLRSRLDAGVDDLTARDFATLLATIDEMGQYDLSADKVLVAKLSERVANMQDAGWRETAQHQIATFGEHQGQPATQAPECG